MRKFFTLMMALVAVVALNAEQVVFDFTNPAALGIAAPEDGKGTNISGQEIVVDGVTMTNVKVASTDNRIWNSKGVYDLRMYAKNTITFTASESITAVAFEGSALGFNEFTGTTWTGEATSVTLTANMTCKISKITVFLNEPVDVWKADTINVAKARELIDKQDAHDHYVKGIVATQPFNTFSDFKDGRVSFYLLDDLQSKDSLQAYQVLDKNNAKWASLEAAWEELRIGDTVLVYAGGLKLYAAKNIYEIDPGHYVEKLGANPNPPDIVVPEVPQADTITVAQALEIGMALEDNKTTPVEYVVAGYARNPKDPKEGYNDQTWYMADEPDAYGEFSAYQCTPDSKVNDNDFMLVRGKILKYVGSNNNPTIEISKGTAVHGVAPEIEYELITVAKALQIAQELKPEKSKSAYSSKSYAVQGFVVGISENKENTFYLADEVGVYGEFQAYQCSSVDYIVTEGDLVIVTGKISHYWGEGDNGEYHTYEISKGKLKHAFPEGIENVVLTEKAQKVVVDGVIYIVRDGKMFNLQGAQVR